MVICKYRRSQKILMETLKWAKSLYYPQGSPSQQTRNAYQLCCSPPGKNSSDPRRPLRALPLWRSPCWHLRMTWGWRYSRFPLRTWSLTPPRWMRSHWRSLGRQDAGLEHGKEGGMNDQTNACLCGVWSCQPAAKYISCKSPKKLRYLDTKRLHQHLTSVYIMVQGFKSRSSCMLGKQSTTIHTPNNFWILLLFSF